MKRSFWSAKRLFVLAYVGLLVVSGIWKEVNPVAIDPREGQHSAWVTRGGEDGVEVEIRYLDTVRGAGDARPTLVILHGSPMASETFNRVIPYLSDRYRLIVPDLPGFGRSQRKIPDYSIESHAEYLESLLDSLDVSKAHFVGYSMGGGVGLLYSERNPEEVESLALVSSIGLQEYELLGDYTLNHALHAVQLFGLWAVEWLTPHFGWMDRALLNYEYARNFYDTDQRPLRDSLIALKKPTLILHGETDGLVPFQAALAHKAMLPHARLVVYEKAGHLAIYRQTERFANDLTAFVEDVESGAAESGDELAAIDESAVAGIKRSGVFMGTLLGLATFASEDLACIGGGLLATKGAVSLQVAILGCLLGIFVGDFAIYLMGRLMGESALKLPLVRRLLHKERVDQCARWFDKKEGMALIVSTRFIPGSRVPTYFAAGVVKASPFKFGLALFVAAAVWTPVIVGLSYWLGGAFLEFFEKHEGLALIGLLVSAVSILFLARGLSGLMTWKGRRLLFSRFKRIVRWEFWPMWLFYPPVIVYLLWKMLRYRSVTMLTAVNPCMPASGLVYESKGQILAHLQKHGVPVGRFEVIPLDWDDERKLSSIRAFMEQNGLSYPIVLKPDVGERGEGVAIVKSDEEASGFLEAQEEDSIVQEFLPGREYGVFYYRLPNEKRGSVLSITDKRFVFVTGDGKSNLERLILSDRRAIGMARFFLGTHQNELDRVIPEGESFALAELGTHCRGALFLDGSRLITPELVDSIDSMSRDVDGFHFGRYDVRVPSEEDLMAGENIRIIELNGLTSESTNIYDPKHGLLFAYRTLFKQWDIAFRIARESVTKGNRPESLRTVSRLIARHLMGKASEREG